MLCQTTYCARLDWVMGSQAQFPLKTIETCDLSSNKPVSNLNASADAACHVLFGVKSGLTVGDTLRGLNEYRFELF